MTTHTVMTADNVELNVTTEGDPSKPAVLLHHSLGGSLAQWDALTPVLVQNFHVIRYDCRGHGESDAPDGEYSLETLADDAMRVMDAVGADKAAVIGLSLGGVAAMQLGIESRARVSALVLANTTTYIPNKQMWDDNVAKARRDGMEAIARPTLERWFGQSFRSAHPSEFEKHVGAMTRMPVNGYIGCCAVLRDVDLRERIQEISAPTLVIAGEEDMPQAVSGAQTMASEIPGAEFSLIEKAAHMSPIENCAAFSHAVEAFLLRS